jgi:DNA ligase (NAD+)
MAKKVSCEELRNQLLAANAAYRSGESIMSDVEYDALVEKLRKLDPSDIFFNKGIVEAADDRMEELPVPMYSLEKIKEIKPLRKWLKKMLDAGACEVVAMPKFDGISLLTYDMDGDQAWTRGDGIEGQRSDAHFTRMNNGKPKGYFCNVHTWGEAICKKTTFAHLKDELNVAYKNARNMVAGVFNSPDGFKNPVITYIDFVRYGIDEPIDKDDQLRVLRNRYQNVTPSRTYLIEELLELDDADLNDLIDLELHDEFDAEYKIDGIVLEINEWAVKQQLGRLPNGNPAYSVAFKREEWCDIYQTKVTGIEKGIGKTGVLNPVILIEPVEINGATVSRATAYNAAYLVENNICEGAVIEVTRGGDVIPKHLKTLEYNETMFEKMCDDLVICPSCGKPLKWNETNVDLVCTNDKCKEMVISEMVYFFRTMGCEQFEEPTIRRLYGHGYKTIDTILESHVAEFQNLLGKSKGKTVSSQIEKVLAGVPLARYLTAINVFDGKIAEATCQKILDGLDERVIEKLRNSYRDEFTAEFAVALKHECELIPGIGEVLALTFVKGLKTYISRGKDRRVVITYVQSPKVETPDGVEQMHVCMTGFRNKELEKALQAQGHVVLNGVTKECTVLVVADINSTSSKMKTAKQRGLRIVTREDFENEILLQR